MSAASYGHVFVQFLFRQSCQRLFVMSDAHAPEGLGVAALGDAGPLWKGIAQGLSASAHDRCHKNPMRCFPLLPSLPEPLVFAARLLLLPLLPSLPEPRVFAARMLLLQLV